jgi:hypothetical protein
MSICKNAKNTKVSQAVIALLFIAVIYIVWNSVNSRALDVPCTVEISNKRNDYWIPSVQDYKPGCSSKVNQEEKELSLYSKIYMESENEDPEQLDTDECRVLAKDSESTKSQIMRSVIARDGDLVEGTYTPDDEIESRMMKMRIR